MHVLSCKRRIKMNGYNEAMHDCSEQVVHQFFDEIAEALRNIREKLDSHNFELVADEFENTFGIKIK